MSLTDKDLDVAKEKIRPQRPVDLVGLYGLRMPVRLNPEVTVSACLDAHVSLSDRTARGIHMSRLYLSLHEHFAQNTVSFSGLKKLLTNMIQSQKDISDSGRLKLSAHWPVLRKALKSQISGWREYPFFYEVDYSAKTDSFKYIMGGEILYSSTCPCSASLSRNIIKKSFSDQFSKDAPIKKQDLMDYLNDKSFLSATPHAQKSELFFKIRWEGEEPPFSLLNAVDKLEKALGTPVQTAVKREDEGEFARLNASQLMFCEDAARHASRALDEEKQILDYKLRARHYESLHPFTVESSIVKGMDKGWRV